MPINLKRVVTAVLFLEGVKKLNAPIADMRRQRRLIFWRVLKMLLKDLNRGEVATIVSLQGHTGDSKKLLAMGILPGSKISLLQKYPSYIFQVGNSQFVGDEQMASSIQVT